mmetsp:Transcript_23656/g.50105  ORF Transcript_23656/g.50105 Transcript_23656/m.50105 type:complete len:220 (+) Transcript_23656:1325-1984(+)
MTNNDHGNVLIAQECLEPFHTVEIEVVGRFIKKEDVGVFEQYLSKTNAHLPPTRKHGYLIITLLRLKSHQIHNLTNPRIQRVDILVIRLGLQFGHAIQHLLHLIGIAPIHTFQFLFGLRQSLHNFRLLGKHAREFVAERPGEIDLVDELLPQHGHAQIFGGFDDVSRGGFQFAAHDPQLGRFSGTVRADQSDPVSRLYAPRGTFQDGLISEGDGNVFET